MIEFLQKNHAIIAALILGLILLFALTNCIPKNLTYQDTSVQMSRVAIQYSTLKFIGTDQLKAQHVSDIVAWAYTEVEDNEYITLSVLEQEIRKRIPWENLIPSDKFAVEEFLTYIKTYLMQVYTDIGLDAEYIKVYVKEVLLWIDESANLVLEK